MATQTFTNTARGPRGVRKSSGELVMIDPGQSVDIEDVSDAELKSVKDGGEVVIGKAAAKAAEAEAEKADEKK